MNWAVLHTDTNLGKLKVTLTKKTLLDHGTLKSVISRDWYSELSWLI